MKQRKTITDIAHYFREQQFGAGDIYIIPFCIHIRTAADCKLIRLYEGNTCIED